MQETWVQSLDQEDPLEKEMAAHSSILAWKIPWTEKPDGLQSRWIVKESDTTLPLNSNKCVVRDKASETSIWLSYCKKKQNAADLNEGHK